LFRDIFYREYVDNIVDEDFYESFEMFRKHVRASKYGIANANVTGEQKFGLNSTTVQMTYLCNVRAMKDPGSFIASVGSATISLYLLIWGLVMSLLGDWARQTPHGMRAFSAISSTL
jgi:hypothetical protein